jgi:hypothetical protein
MGKPHEDLALDGGDALPGFHCPTRPAVRGGTAARDTNILHFQRGCFFPLEGKGKVLAFSAPGDAAMAAAAPTTSPSAAVQLAWPCAPLRDGDWLDKIGSVYVCFSFSPSMLSQP